MFTSMKISVFTNMRVKIEHWIRDVIRQELETFVDILTVTNQPEPKEKREPKEFDFDNRQ